MRQQQRSQPGSAPLDWAAARRTTYEAGLLAKLLPVRYPIGQADGATLAEALRTLTPLPAFPTSSVDGYAVRGEGPWRLSGRVLAGGEPGELRDGTAVEIATGAMVPERTERLIRVENATVADGHVSVENIPGPRVDVREIGEEAGSGEELLPEGHPVTPGVIGLAASCGHDLISVRPKPRAALLIFGDELAVTGPPGHGRVRDALGPSLPSMLAHAGAEPVPGFRPRGPIDDTLEAHVSALRAALDDADVVCTTGGTMHGPVDHLHPALAELGASYVVNTVAVRPGFPMLVAALPGDRFVVGLPGNPQSAIVAVVSLVLPLLAGLSGRDFPATSTVELGADIAGRGDYTHLSLVKINGRKAYPLPHAGSAMLRGLAAADGFAIIPPGEHGSAGQQVGFVRIPS
ncbi:molybdopterin molybdotransferase MoeA [Phytomonospora endophytica]|uniref:Molybdopterin molybdenumtransferase n=1 Tax=Phytomonospora endophytica TaxID=714109 RepID=A0A841FUC4_9ACTN|nr:molybdopterin molybdotransferase MoeA [Phytomonospora endophytica]MBB6039955.1 molybdopterin molybdotransferase [Phytomonospora endophytica]GIG70974.1 molybdopterin molybdenumtransferase MoeA [Phytomonospora endophytica]